MRNRTYAEGLGDEIRGLFEDSDCYLLLMSDGLADGSDGIRALQLIGNCLGQQFWEEGIPKDHAKTPRAEEASRRSVKVGKALKKFAAKSKAWFVVCYNLRHSSDWGMAWSNHVEPEVAFEQVANFVKCGLQLEMD